MFDRRDFRARSSYDNFCVATAAIAAAIAGPGIASAQIARNGRADDVRRFIFNGAAG
jgi:hypothetical protein